MENNDQDSVEGGKGTVAFPESRQKPTPELSANPHIYGYSTRLSNAYTIGRDGIRCPPWASERSSHAYEAWKRGHDEFLASEQKGSSPIR